MRKSRSGTKPTGSKSEPMAQKNLSAEEICLILKACGESQVAMLKYGDLCVRFGKHTETRSGVQALGDPDTVPPTTSATAIAATQDTEAEKSLLQGEVAFREDEVAMMLIEDPARAEQLIMEGELADAGVKPDDGTDDGI